MQLSWWVLPLFPIPPRLHTPQWTLSALALALWSPQCHETALYYARLLEFCTNICDYTSGITVVLLEWQCPLVAILKLEQHRPISTLVSSYLSSHVRLNPLASLAEALKALRPGAPTEALKPPTFDWQTTISSTDQWKAGTAFKEWRKSLMMVPGLSTCLTSLAPLANRNMSSGNLRVPPKLTVKIRRKVLLHSLNTSPPQWITLCPNVAGSIY